jgi:hypothetical protein
MKRAPSMASPKYWCAEFLLEIDLKILLRKTGARLIFKIALISLHVDSGTNIQKNTKKSHFWISLSGRNEPVEYIYK